MYNKNEQHKQGMDANIHGPFLSYYEISCNTRFPLKKQTRYYLIA